MNLRRAAAAATVALAFVLEAPAAHAQQTAALTPGVPVFTYHMVDPNVPTDPIGSALTVTPKQFEEQLQTLARLRLHTITAEALVGDLRRGYLPQHTVVLTFDDGYEDAKTVALPLLRRYGDVATFFVISDNVGRPRHLTWNDIRTMRGDGMEIAAHGVEHVDLTEMDFAGQHAQVAGCAHALERWARTMPLTYAYPSGRYNATTLAVMRHTPLEAAFTERYGFVRSLSDPYELPRIRVLRPTAIATFDAIAAAVR